MTPKIANTDNVGLPLVVTDAGREAAISADDAGLQLALTEIALGDGLWNPNSDATGLQNEIKRLDNLGGSNVAPDIIHLTFTDDTTDEYQLGEFGLYTDTGILFAIYSQDSHISEKIAESVLIISADMKLDTVPPGSVTIEGNNFHYPPATEELMGVVELATEEEVLEGTDPARVVTCETLHSKITSGVLPKPDFEMTLKSDIHIDEGFGSSEFSRDSSATYIDKSGVLRIAGVDEPRFEKNGILIEGEETNLEVDYDLSISGSASDTDDGVITPVTLAGIPMHEYAGDSISKYKTNRNIGENQAGIIYTVSVFFRTGDAFEFRVTPWSGSTGNSAGVSVDADGNTEVKGSSSYLDVVDHGVLDYGVVSRVYFTLETVNGGDGQNIGTYHITADSTIVLGGIQVEKTNRITSMIPTDGTPVTRSADVLTVDGSNLPSLLAKGTISLWIDRPTYPSYSRIWRNGGSSEEGNILGLTTYSEGAALEFFYGDSYTSAIFKNKSVITQTYQDLSQKGYINGELVLEYTPAQVIEHENPIIRISPGNEFFGHIRNFRIWHRALTPEQIALIGD